MPHLAHPLFLLALLSLIVLTLLHLLKRKKLDTIPFSSIQFILRSHKRLSRKLRLKQILLYIIRTLIIIVIILLIANTFRIKESPGLKQGDHGNRLIVLDNRYQMNLKQGKLSDFERGKNEIRAFFQQAGKSDALFVNNQAVRITSPDQLEQLLEQIKPVIHTNQSTLHSLRQNREKIKQYTPVIVTNYPINISSGKIALIPHQKINNNTIESITLKRITATQYQATASIYSGSTQTGQTDLTLFQEKAIKSSQKIILKPGEHQNAVFYFSVKKNGVYRLKLKDDDLQTDNEIYFTLNPEKPINILIVNGDPSPIPHRDESFYFLNALKSDPLYYNWKITHTTRVQASNLSQYGVVTFLNYNFSRLYERKKIDQFLAKGGSILITTGNQTPITGFNTFWNNTLKLRNKKVMKQQSRYKYITGINRNYPPFKSLSVLLDEMMHYPIFQYYNIVTGQKITPLLSLNDGTPILVEKKKGAGKIILYLSSIDREWNDFPLSTQFPPVIISLVKSLLSSINTEMKPLLRDIEQLEESVALNHQDPEPGWYTRKNGRLIGYTPYFKLKHFSRAAQWQNHPNYNQISLKGDQLKIPLKKELLLLLLLLLIIELIVGLKGILRKKKHG